MRPRRWIIVVCLLFSVLFAGIYGLKLSLEKNRNLEQILVKNISPLVGGGFDVKKIRIGFFSAELTGVQLVIPLQSFSLHVQNIKVGLSFFKLVTSRWDFKKGINKIIFVDPTIEISIPFNGSEPKTPSTLTKEFSIASFPFQHLLVKNCTVLLVDRAGEKIALGEQLSGKIGEFNRDIHFKLQGKLASLKRNLTFSGVLSHNKKQQHISLRLDKAHIKNPIKWRDYSIIDGKVDGVCEFSFKDTAFPDNIDANGWLHIKECTGAIDGIEKKVENINARLKFIRNRIVIDTLHARWSGIDIFARCATGFSPLQENRVFIKCDGILQSHLTFFPEQVQNSISGTGWVEAEAVKREGSSTFAANVSAGGFSVGKHPVKRLAAVCSFNTAGITVDTAFFECPGIAGGMQGLVNYEKPPLAYSFNGAIFSDLKTLAPAMTGKASLRVTVNGLGGSPAVNLQLNGNAVTYHAIPLGNPHISIAGTGNSLIIDNKKSVDGYFVFDGVIDSVLTKEPSIRGHVQCGTKLVTALLAGPQGSGLARSIDSAKVEAEVFGRLSNLQAHARIFCKGDKFSARTNLSLSRDTGTKPFVWDLEGGSVVIADTVFPFSASGELNENVVVVKKLAGFHGISGSGYFETGDDGAVDGELLFKNVPCTNMNPLFSKETKTFEYGFINGNVRLFGKKTHVRSSMQLGLSNVSVAGISNLFANVVIMSSDTRVTILPFVVRKDTRVILSVDTVSNANGIRFSGSFEQVALEDFLKDAAGDGFSLAGPVSGKFATTGSGFPVSVTLHSNRVMLNSFAFDSVSADVHIHKNGIEIEQCRASDATRSYCTVKASIPWPYMAGSEEETDTMHATVQIQGDLLSSLEHALGSTIGGRGKGEVFLDFSITPEEWYFHQAYAVIPKGTITIDPYVPDKVKNVSLRMDLDNASKLHVNLAGKIDKRPVIITNTHEIPKGFEPIMIGPVNCGIIQMKTPKDGIPVFLLGFVERGTKADIDFVGREPLKQFSISGPADRLRVSGVWLLRNTEFTFPPLEDAPLPPTVNWDMDIKPGNRKLAYFYNAGGKRRRMIRFTECYLDPPTSVLKLRGRDIDGSFRLYGKIRSYKGFVFYGKTFDRNFNVGVDFVPEKTAGGKGYDNMPIIWGSAEAFSDTSRFDRIKLTLLTRDPKTGALSEKGRFKDITFRVSSDFEEIPGEAEMDFYREAGLEFINIKGTGKKAGEMVSSMGDQFFNRYLLQRFERRLARSLGLDVISLETSIASNYFNYLYNNETHFGDLAQKWDYLIFANIGVTFGRYLLKDKVFLKWRTELIPNNLLLLVPEHNIGFEYQPFEYFWVDFNYGFYREADVFINNPKFLMQLRVPIGKSTAHEENQ